MMHFTPLRVLLISSLLVAIVSCTETETSREELKLDCLYDHMETMNVMLDTARLGNVDGTFPYESARELQNAISDLQYGISMAKADRFILQYQVNNYCIAAQKAIDAFKSSYQITLDPGTPAELQVFGIDQEGRIEFGADPAFGGSDAFTVESWLKYDEGFYESAIGDFIATFNNTADPYEGWMINFMGDNLRATIGMGPQSSRVLEFGGKYPENYREWNHIAMVYNAALEEGQLKLYLNGEVFFEKTNDIVDETGALQEYQPNVQNTNMWAFMEPTDNSRCMTGYIRKFRMWQTAKTQEEINTLMNSNVQGDEDKLVCAWDFTEMPGDIENIPDKTGNHSAKIVGRHKWYPLN